MRLHYAYQFKTEQRRFSTLKWLGIGILAWLGGLLFQTGIFLFLSGPPPEAALRLLEGFPTNLRISNSPLIEGSPARSDIEFTIDGNRIHYNSQEPKYEEVRDAVIRAERKIEIRQPFERIEHGEQLQVWVYSSPNGETLYKLSARGQPVLRYSDPTTRQSTVSAAAIIVGVTVLAFGLRSVYRFFRPKQQRLARNPLAEMETSPLDLFLLDPNNQRFMERSKHLRRDSPVTSLIWAAVTLGGIICLSLVWRDAFTSTLCAFALLFLGFVKIYLHRRALLPIGLPIRAPAECVSRTRTIDDDGSDLDIIEIDFVFQAPTGSVVHGSLVGPVRQGEFSYLPARATRFAMAVLYFGPEDYVVL